MGENADQTSSEIAALRNQMGERIGDLRDDVVPKLRRARRIAITAAGVGVGVLVIGTVAAMTYSARRRRQERSLRGRVEAVADAATHPKKAATKGKKVVEETVEERRDKIRAELREQLMKELELQDHEPLYQRMATTAIKSAAAAAIPIIMKQMEKRSNGA
jgi:hypothetical protein